MCEFRNRQLVGLAAMDLNQRELILCQYGDNHTYSTTAMWVHHYMPREVRNSTHLSTPQSMQNSTDGRC